MYCNAHKSLRGEEHATADASPPRRVCLSLQVTSEAREAQTTPSPLKFLRASLSPSLASLSRLARDSEAAISSSSAFDPSQRSRRFHRASGIRGRNTTDPGDAPRNMATEYGCVKAGQGFASSLAPRKHYPEKGRRYALTCLTATFRGN